MQDDIKKVAINFPHINGIFTQNSYIWNTRNGGVYMRVNLVPFMIVFHYTFTMRGLQLRVVKVVCYGKYKW